MPYRRFTLWVSAQYFEHLVSLSDSYRYVLRKAARGKHCLFRCDRMGLHALQGKVFQLIEEQHSDRFGKDIKLRLCANDLILQINRMAYEQDHPGYSSASMDLYENILQYIEDHLEEELTLDYLIVFYVGKFHIAHIFKENLGISVHQYILKKRLAMCRDAILGSTSITEAYLLYGFKDYSAFFRAFQRSVLSPKEYRELCSFRSQTVILCSTSCTPRSFCMECSFSFSAQVSRGCTSVLWLLLWTGVPAPISAPAAVYPHPKNT